MPGWVHFMIDIRDGDKHKHVNDTKMAYYPLSAVTHDYFLIQEGKFSPLLFQVYLPLVTLRVAPKVFRLAYLPEESRASFVQDPSFWL